MGWGSRLPSSNDPPRAGQNPWGATEMLDDTAILLNELGRRCQGGCHRVIRNEFLIVVSDHGACCPDCAQKHGMTASQTREAIAHKAEELRATQAAEHQRYRSAYHGWEGAYDAEAE